MSTVKITQEERQAGRIFPQDFAQFQEMPNAETDDGRYGILVALVTDELPKFEKMPLS